MVIKKVKIKGRTYTITGLKRIGKNYHVTVNNKTIIISLENTDYESPSTVWINDKPRKLQLIKTSGSILYKLDGKTYEPKLLEELTPKTSTTQKREDLYNGLKSPVYSGKPTTADKNIVTAFMPGRIVLLKVKPGDNVKVGDTLCVLEAMKMENEITAPKAGVVQEVMVSEGLMVNKGDELVKIK